MSQSKKQFLKTSRRYEDLRSQALNYKDVASEKHIKQLKKLVIMEYIFSSFLGTKPVYSALQKTLLNSPFLFISKTVSNRIFSVPTISKFYFQLFLSLIDRDYIFM